MFRQLDSHRNDDVIEGLSLREAVGRKSATEQEAHDLPSARPMWKADLRMRSGVSTLCGADDEYSPQSGHSSAIFTGDIQQAVSMAQRAVELGPSDADGPLFLAVALFASGEIVDALRTVERALQLNPLRPAYYCFFHALILWGNGRLQEALEETEECLRKAPSFGAAELYRVIALVGLGRLDEARARLAQYMARPGGKALMFPRPPELASRGLAALKTAGWRPSVVAHREAV